MWFQNEMAHLFRDCLCSNCPFPQVPLAVSGQQPAGFSRVGGGILGQPVGRGQGPPVPWLPVLRILGLLFGYLCLRRRRGRGRVRQVMATGVGDEVELAIYMTMVWANKATGYTVTFHEIHYPSTSTTPARRCQTCTRHDQRKRPFRHPCSTD
jgi:hypothetical protein